MNAHRNDYQTRLAHATAAHDRRLAWLTDGIRTATPGVLRDAARRAEYDAVDTLTRFVNDLTHDAIALRDEIRDGHPATSGVSGDWAFRAAILARDAVATGSLNDAGELGRVSGDLAAAEYLRHRAYRAELAARLPQAVAPTLALGGTR